MDKHSRIGLAHYIFSVLFWSILCVPVALIFTGSWVVGLGFAMLCTAMTPGGR